jgi:hypothetical protein
MSIPLPEFEPMIPMIVSAKIFRALDFVACPMDFPFFVENNVENDCT